MSQFVATRWWQGHVTYIEMSSYFLSQKIETKGYMRDDNKGDEETKI